MQADVGTSWAKILDENGNQHILPTKQVLKEEWFFNKATGHLGKNRCRVYINELEALGRGALSVIADDNFTVVDIGSRDTKFIYFKDRKVSKLDWNQSCGASTGFTLELLLKYYEIDYNKIEVNTNESFDITCAVFGLEKIFDTIIQGDKVEKALGRFLMGIAFNIFEFTYKPKKIYLSGGLSEMDPFVKALSFYTEVVRMGRFLLLQGLK